ncbi:MAG TPA: RNA polymerase sigma-70 factor [Ohtaekwangia sp.]|nr:RNA polymerase sigma-70 factor [Ohtaekwangia sp.]
MTSPIKPVNAVPEQILTSLKEGDRFAFEYIYNRYADRLFSFINGKIRAKEITEEIIQEIFVSLWANRQTMEIHTAVEAYLFGAAKNQVLYYIRKEYVRREYAAEFARFAREQYDNSVVEQTDLHDLESTIQQKVAELPGQCQVAFRMSRMEHTPIAQIAKKMNISTRTVENYISQALRHLRTNLGELLVTLLFAFL